MVSTVIKAEVTQRINTLFTLMNCLIKQIYGMYIKYSTYIIFPTLTNDVNLVLDISEF